MFAPRSPPAPGAGLPSAGGGSADPDGVPGPGRARWRRPGAEGRGRREQRSAMSAARRCSPPRALAGTAGRAGAGVALGVAGPVGFGREKGGERTPGVPGHGRLP